MLKTTILFAAIVLVIFVFGYNRQNKRKVLFTKLAPAPLGPYSQAIRSGGILYVSGQVGLKPDGGLDSTSIETESRQALNNIKAILEEAGMEMNDINKATVYLTDLQSFSKFNEVYKTYFVKDPPARETVEVKALPKHARVEISVIAE